MIVDVYIYNILVILVFMYIHIYISYTRKLYSWKINENYELYNVMIL